MQRGLTIQDSGTVYKDAVSFVTASVLMRLRLSFTRRRSSSLSEPGRFEYAFKSGAFSKRYGFIGPCKRRNRIDLKTVWREIGWLAK